MRIAVVFLLLLAAPAGAQAWEDDAHRADRLRTQALNRRSPSGYPAAPRAAAAADDGGRDDYAQAQAEYRRRLAEWRRRVAACENGYYDACER